MSSVEVIEHDGKAYVCVDNLIDFLRRQHGEAYWWNGQQTIIRMIEALKKRVEFVEVKRLDTAITDITGSPKVGDLTPQDVAAPGTP